MKERGWTIDSLLSVNVVLAGGGVASADGVKARSHVSNSFVSDVSLETWMGYSIGRWEHDALVVTTSGLTDRSWLDVLGHPHTESLVMTERFRRVDVGHLDIEVTYSDPGTFKTPLTITQKLRLLPGQELLEYFCADNEKDRQRYVTTN